MRLNFESSWKIVMPMSLHQLLWQRGLGLLSELLLRRFISLSVLVGYCCWSVGSPLRQKVEWSLISYKITQEKLMYGNGHNKVKDCGVQSYQMSYQRLRSWTKQQSKVGTESQSLQPTVKVESSWVSNVPHSDLSHATGSAPRRGMFCISSCISVFYHIGKAE